VKNRFCVKIPVLPYNCYVVFLGAFENYIGNLKYFKLPNAPPIFTFPSNKILKLKIEALFQLLNVYTYTKIKKNHTSL